MNAQRVIGIAIVVASAGLGVWQATNGNKVATALGALGALGGFFPAIHKAAVT
jgi:hypothetical protein